MGSPFPFLSLRRNHEAVAARQNTPMIADCMG